MVNYFNKNFLYSAIIILIHQYYFQSFLPGINGLFGSDFTYAGALHTQGKIWFEKNLLSTPWFAPSQCCGDFMYAGIHDGYYSILQILFIITNPVHAVKIHFFIYSVLSFVGGYFLFKRSFNLSSQISLLGASLILFNGFFNYRYIAGHSLFASFNLIALYAFFIIESSKTNLKSLRSLFYVCLASIIFSSAMYHGHFLSVPFMAISIFIVLLIYFLTNEKNINVIYNFLFSLVIGILTSLSKIGINFKLVSLHPRNYPSSEYTSFLDYLSILIKGLFFSPNEKDQKFIDQNIIDKVLLHEFEYSISVVPIIILVSCLFFLNKNFSISKKQKITLAALLLSFVSIIIIQNFPQISSQLPVINSIWLKPRFNCLFIFPIITFSMLLLSKLNFKETKYKNYFILFLFFTLILQNLFKDKSFYLNGYTSLDTYDLRKYNKKIKDYKIDRNLVIADTKTKRISADVLVHHMFLDGASLLNCDNAVYGYSLENFRHKEKIRFYIDRIEYSNDTYTYFYSSPFDIVDNKYFNFFNPACVLFPKENNCGDLPFFKISQKKELEKFLNYEKYDFKLSLLQNIYNYISLISFIIIVMVMLVFAFRYNKYNRKFE